MGAQTETIPVKIISDIFKKIGGVNIESKIFLGIFK